MKVVPKSGTRVMGTVAAQVASIVTREETKTRSRMLAYASVGAKLGKSGEWVRKVVSGAVRTVNIEVKARIDALLIRELELEIQRLTHELGLVRQRGDHPASFLVGEIEAHLAKARELMGQRQ